MGNQVWWDKSYKVMSKIVTVPLPLEDPKKSRPKDAVQALAESGLSQSLIYCWYFKKKERGAPSSVKTVNIINICNDPVSKVGKKILASKRSAHSRSEEAKENDS